MIFYPFTKTKKKKKLEKKNSKSGTHNKSIQSPFPSDKKEVKPSSGEKIVVS